MNWHNKLMGLIFHLCLLSHVMLWQLILPPVHLKFFVFQVLQGTKERRDQQHCCCFVACQLPYIRKDNKCLKWSDRTCKVRQRKIVFWTNLLYQFGHRGGKRERRSKKVLKQGKKAQYSYLLDLVIYPNQINRIKSSFRAWFWEVKLFQILFLNYYERQSCIGWGQIKPRETVTWLPKFTEREYCSHPSHHIRCVNYTCKAYML